MAQYISLKVKLSSSELNISRSITKKSDRCSLKIIIKYDW